MQAQQDNNIDAIGKSVIEKIKTHSEEGAGDVSLETPLADLGIHSLELTEIIFDIEDEFGIEVEMSTVEAWENLETVRDIVEAVRELIDAKS